MKHGGVAIHCKGLVEVEWERELQSDVIFTLRTDVLQLNLLALQ